MMEFIAIWILTILSIGFGYYLGSKRHPQKDITTIIKTASQRLDQAIQESPLAPGPIKRPTAQDLASRNQDPMIKDSKTAVKESLDQVPELQQAKAHVEKLKAEGAWIP